MKTDRELLEEIVNRLERMEKKATSRYTTGLGFILIAAAIALWGWSFKSQTIDMNFNLAGWGV